MNKEQVNYLANLAAIIAQLKYEINSASTNLFRIETLRGMRNKCSLLEQHFAEESLKLEISVSSIGAEIGPKVKADQEKSTVGKAVVVEAEKEKPATEPLKIETAPATQPKPAKSEESVATKEEPKKEVRPLKTKSKKNG